MKSSLSKNKFYLTKFKYCIKNKTKDLTHVTLFVHAVQGNHKAKKKAAIYWTKNIKNLISLKVNRAIILTNKPNKHK